MVQCSPAVKDDSIAQCRAEQDYHKKQIEELDAGFNQESIMSLENTGEMQRQHREMQNSFNERIEDLQTQVGVGSGRSVCFWPCRGGDGKGGTVARFVCKKV